MRRFHAERVGTVILLAATILVGVSITLDGQEARAVNGVAGITWFAAAAMLVLAAWRQKVQGREWIGVVALTAVVAFVVRPSDIWLAMLGFGLSGVVLAIAFPRHGPLLARLMVGLHLPFHIGTAVIKAIARNLAGNESSIRSDPPPTAVVVPLVMLVAAVIGVELVRFVRSRKGSESTASEARNESSLAG